MTELLEVSIHGLLRALTSTTWVLSINSEVSIHGLLRALTNDCFRIIYTKMFQSTGSYEP